MRKFAWIGFSLVLFFVLMVLSPLGIGFYAKNKLTAAVGKLQARNPMLVVRITDYQRHWFTSTATIQIGLNPLKAAPTTGSSTPLAVTVNTEIVHGPILWQKNTAQGFPLDFGLAYASGLLQLNKDSIPITAQWLNRSDLGLIGLKFNFLGGMHLVLQWLPFVFSDPTQGLKLSVQGAVTQWWTNADVSRVRFEQNNQGVLLQSPTLEARFEQPTILKVEQHKVNDKVWIGNVDMNIPLLQMQASKELPLRFDAIHLSYDTELNDRFLDTKTTIHIDNVKRGGEDAYRGLIIEASADHLDLSAVQTILQLSQQLNAALSEMNAVSAKRGQSSDAQSSAIEAAYIDRSKQVFLVQQQFFLAATQLLKEGAQFSIKQFHLGTPQGDVDGAFSIAFAKAPADKPLLGLVQAVNNAAIQMDFALPKSLMQTVLTNFMRQHENASSVPENAAEAHDALSMPSLAEQTQARASKLLSKLLAEQLLLDQNGRYGFVLDYQEGKLTLNHEPITMMEFIKKLSSTSSESMSITQVQGTQAANQVVSTG